MPKIIPIRDLKNTTAISECCHAVGEPFFVPCFDRRSTRILRRYSFFDCNVNKNSWIKMR